MSGLINSVGSKSGIIGTTELGYEEGSWTPNPYSQSGAWGSDSGVTVYGLYVKVGKMVTLNGFIGNRPIGSAGGGIRITGLPFSCVSSTKWGVVTVQNYYAPDNALAILGQDDETQISFLIRTHAWNVHMEVSHLTNYWYPIFSVTYKAA